MRLGERNAFRHTRDGYTDPCVVDHFRGRSMMELGGISHNGKTQLVIVKANLNAQKYRDEILTPVVFPFMIAGNGAIILQRDCARPHTERAITQFLSANKVNVMEWSLMSPLSTSGTNLIGFCVLALISLLTVHSFRQPCFKSGKISPSTAFFVGTLVS